MVKQTAGRDALNNFAPKFAELNDDVLFGDVVTIPAEVKHWHGAQKDCWFSHIAIECPGEETSNEWCEPVTDAEYAALDADCAQNP